MGKHYLPPQIFRGRGLGGPRHATHNPRQFMTKRTKKKKKKKKLPVMAQLF
jgi:hypothetical protein